MTNKQFQMNCALGMSKCYIDCPYWRLYMCKFPTYRKQLADLKAMRR